MPTSSARTTIYLPPDIQERLLTYKGRLNVSAVCQAALIAEMDRLDVREVTLARRRAIRDEAYQKLRQEEGQS